MGRKKPSLNKFFLKFVLPIGTAAALPFAFNACQGKLLGGSFAASSLGAQCKAMLENGVVTELKFNPAQAPLPFRTSKVRLRDGIPTSPKDTDTLQKLEAPLKVASGTKLGVIVNNQCLDEMQDQIAKTQISKAAVTSGERINNLDRQVYLWQLDQDYTENEIETLANNEPCVVGISWNRTYKIQSFNDPSYAQQTYLSAIHADQAYARFYAGQGTMQTTSGNPVLLAVVDTGVDYTHPDLQGSIWQHSQGMGVDITTLGTANVSYNPYDVSDIGHGTHVSGSIAAVANNAQGIAGAMPYRAKIMGIKIFSRDAQGNTSTTSQYFYNGVKFAYQNGANAINLSLGSVTDGPSSDSLAESAVNEAVQHGVTTIVVIGNEDSGGNGRLVDGSNLSSIPGQYATTAGVIGVGSFDALTGQKSYFSHYSTTYAEIGAPGAEQGQTGNLSTIPVALGSYGRLEGTSQAAPIVTAAAGLTIGLIREAYGVAPSPAEVERLILTSAIKSSALTPYFKNGNRLDFLSLVNQINLSYPLTGKGQTPVTLSGNCQN